MLTMNVFLSHSTKDADFVKALAARMTAEGFTPWLCESSIAPATDWVEEIEKGLKAADLVLLVWSPDAAASYATGLEWTAALAREIRTQRKRLGVVLLRDCDLPELLYTRQYIDARSDSDKAIVAVLDWLAGRRDLGRLAGDFAPVFLEDYPKDDFVGRTGYLAELRQVFSDGPARFLLHGEPGAGKSTLALRFAWEAQKDFDAVVFQRCGQRSVAEIVSELAYKLRRPLGEQVVQLPPEEKLKAAAEWLRARPSLLVLDDVWSAEVKQLEPGGPCSVLHTSRQQALPWISSGHSSAVVSFSDEECEALFHATLDGDFSRDEVTRNREALLGFAKRVERLPIAVAVGANLLRQKKASGLQRGTLRLRLEKLRDGVQDVNALFRAAIESRPESEQKLLAAAAVCAQEGFWLPLAAAIAGLSEDDAGDTADRLVHSSLLRVIDRERRRFQLHALLREQVRAKQGSDGLSKLQERHAANLERIFGAWYVAQDQETRWQECRGCLEEIIPSCAILWTRGECEREWQLGLRGYSLGLRIGELEAALRIMKQEELFWEGRDDLEAKNTLQRTYGNEALILQAWGRLEEALALHKQKEAICLELGDKIGLSRSYGNQATILKIWGRLGEALAFCKRVEEIALELSDKDSLMSSYGSQVLILKDWGRLEEALAFCKRVEEIAVELGDKDSLQRSYGNRANIRYAQGCLEEALELHKKKEAICLELGNKDGLQISYGNQALILQAWGRLEEAMALHKKEEAICLELGNKEGLQRSYGNQANILQNWGRSEEAMELHKKKEAICQELGNRKHLAESYGNQALILQAWGRLEEAMGLLKEVEHLCVELGYRDNLQKTCGNQALILQAWGRLEEALGLYKKQEAICLELGNIADLATSYGNQAIILATWGRLEEALALFKKREAICLELGNKSSLAKCYWNWGLLARAQGDLKTEKEKLEQALAIFTELKMPRERDAVQAELKKVAGG